MDLKDIDEMISILATLHDDRFETEDGIEWKGFDSDVDDEDEGSMPRFSGTLDFKLFTKN